ncbi:hypothetical protein HEQ72_07395 [Haematospirillum sp. 15-248]|uniref:hypothetical protein n=1 Tax=Haematospirillum sp. 15-248 TaxID=2723107 RepID=UPI001438E109|nr:hypothetical protein [Haematospirillum sp. 15-248]NKD88132.1 hypothetical protein [Haematospirillum sp. 15-248]
MRSVFARLPCMYPEPGRTLQGLDPVSANLMAQQRNQSLIVTMDKKRSDRPQSF